MEYFTPIIQNKNADYYHSNYEISNLGNVRRIGTTKNLKKHCGRWKDYDDGMKIIIDDEDVEATVLEINNIKKINIKYDEKVKKLNRMGAKYKEIRTVVNVYAWFTATDMSKANLGFGIKIYNQQNRHEIVELKIIISKTIQKSHMEQFL